MPAPMPGVIPMLSYEDGVAALDWLAKAFGFRERMRMLGPDANTYFNYSVVWLLSYETLLDLDSHLGYMPSLATQSSSLLGEPSGLMARGCLSLSSITPGPRKTPSSRLNPWKTETPFCSLQWLPMRTSLSI